MFDFDEESKDEEKSNIAEAVWNGLFIITMIFIGYYSLTKGHAIEDQTNFIRFTLFGIMMIAFAFIALAVKIAQYFGLEFDWLYLPIFDPEKGLFSLKSGLKFLLITMLIVSFLAFISSLAPQSSISKIFFSLSVGSFKEQTTKGAVVLFGFYNSPAENAFLYFILALFVSVEFLLIGKIWNVDKKWIFLAFLIPNIIIGSVAWLQIHDLVSKDNAIEETSHQIFGGVMAASTLLTGTIIPAEVLHAHNNAFITIKSQYGTTVLFVVFLVEFLILILTTIIVFTRTKENAA